MTRSDAVVLTTLLLKALIAWIGIVQVLSPGTLPIPPAAIALLISLAVPLGVILNGLPALNTPPLPKGEGS